jgi:Flp pilus assembly protein TadD
MNSSKVLKFGFAGLAIAGTMVACNPGAQAFRPNSASAQAGKSEQQAVTFFAKANAAYRQGDITGALAQAERTVELSPRDVGYRMFLADLYLKDGRFQSAQTTFEDVLALDPGNVRAGLSVALARIALGQRGAAIAQLEEMRSAPAADLGLAYALAGDPDRALRLLEPAAREQGAQARVRQNLALAYALAGNWDKARTTAAQDIAPDQLNGRLQQWAALAQPKAAADQVAALLGVTPAAADAGQPVRLALAPAVVAGDGTAFAAAEEPNTPAEHAIFEPPAQVPVQEAPVHTADMSDWVSARDAAAEDEAEGETKPVYAAAVESLVAAKPAVVQANQPAKAYARSFKATPAVARTSEASRGTGRFVVQLGAFSTPAAVERAWASAYKRYGFSAETPLSTVVKLPKGTFHRLSVAGFESHADAARVCRGVKAKGGVCFVRGVAGDAPVQWASRYTSTRRG